jgi:hypothetical protein
VFFKSFLLVAVGSKGTYVRVVGIMQSFQDSLRIIWHDTQPVERPNLVRSRLRRNSKYDIYHTGTNMYGYRDDTYFNRLAHHIDGSHYKSTARKKGAACQKDTNLAMQCGLAPRLSAVPSVHACSK